MRYYTWNVNNANNANKIYARKIHEGAINEKTGET